MVKTIFRIELALVVAVLLLFNSSDVKAALCNFPNDQNVSVSISKIESSPADSYAINNTYIVQTGVVEALQGWVLKIYGNTTPALTGATYKYQIMPYGGNWANNSTFEGNTINLLKPLTLTGHYVIRLCVIKDNYTCYSSEREIKVISVDPNTFNVKSTSTYTINSAGVQIPDKVIEIEGNVTKVNGPTVSKIKWGFIQAAKSSVGNYTLYEKPYVPSSFKWKITNSGTSTIFHDKKVVQMNLQNVYVNDGQQVGNYLYDISTTLGTPADTYDSPGEVLNPTSVENLIDQQNRTTAEATYTIDWSTYKYKMYFKTWLVVFNTQTDQYVPLKELSWSVDLDGSVYGTKNPSVGNPVAPTMPLVSLGNLSTQLQETFSGDTLITYPSKP